MKTLVEKYRPETIKDVFLEEKNYNSIHTFIEKGTFPNLLFYGPPGTGKTSSIVAMAKMIYKEKYNLMVLELNASDNRNIQVVRKIIKEFASCRTLFNTGHKLIILDEVDSMTNDAQFCLRRIMETYSENVRFCFICNYINKIIPAIQSRCSRFKFSNLEFGLIEKRLQSIIKDEKIKITNEVLHLIMEHCNSDMRKILNYLQLFKYHNCSENPDGYFSILHIPNKKYIQGFCTKLLNGDKDLEQYFKDGIKMGYYDNELFAQTFYNILLENFEKIGTERFMKIVNILSLIDTKPTNLENYSAFIDAIKYA